MTQKTQISTGYLRLLRLLRSVLLGEGASLRTDCPSVRSHRGAHAWHWIHRSVGANITVRTPAGESTAAAGSHHAAPGTTATATHAVHHQPRQTISLVRCKHIASVLHRLALRDLAIDANLRELLERAALRVEVLAIFGVNEIRLSAEQICAVGLQRIALTCGESFESLGLIVSELKSVALPEQAFGG
jgi:hypothetical protein